MKKIFSFVVILMVLILLPSALAPQRRGIKLGCVAPEVTLGDTVLLSSLTNNKNYTLLHFWASYDATSRIVNRQYSRLVEQYDSTLVRYVAVSYEHYPVLFDEIMKRDKLSIDNQYYDPAGRSSTLYEQYRLNKGFATYLIDTQGTIIAVNPDKTTIENILGQ